MESGSDWDSMSGDDDIEPASASIMDSSQQKPQPVQPDTPLSKTPLTRSGIEPRAPPRSAENYRNMLNRGNVHGITTFKDKREYDATSQRSTPSQQRRDLQTPNSQDAFQEIEMKENLIAQSISQGPNSGHQRPSSGHQRPSSGHQRPNSGHQKPSGGHQSKKSVLMDSNENLPYTEFEAVGMSPAKAIDQPVVQSFAQNRLRQEYIVPSPAPDDTIQQQYQNKPRDSQQRNVEENEEVPRAHGNRKANRHPILIDDDVIVNQNVPDPLSFDIDIEPSSQNYGHSKRGKGGDIGDIVVFHSAYARDGLEERFLYEEGSRDYYSAYTGTSARMPLIANRVETYTKRGVQEFFGTIQILIDFIVIFIVELLRFLFRQFGRKLFGGIIIVFGDSFLKPLLAASFNGIIQPLFVLVWNMMHAFRKLIEPVLLLTREIFSQLAMLLRSFRLVDWGTNTKELPIVKDV